MASFLQVSYIYYYYAAALIGVLAIPLHSICRPSKDLQYLKLIPVMVIIIIYFLGMFRGEGIDIANYHAAYYMDISMIPDKGFQLLMYVLGVFHLPFEALMALVGVVSIYALLRQAKFFNVSFSILLLVWFLHLVVVRDFAQLRSGLAVSLAVIALTSNQNFTKILLYIVSFSVHFTVAVFILCYESCKRLALIQSSYRRNLLLVLALFMIVIVGQSIPLLGFIDPRIPIYLSWDKDGYGAAVSSFGSLMFGVLLLVIGLYYRRAWSRDVKIATLFYMQVFGVAIFVSFSNYAIFSFRLSGLVQSLYPALVVYIFKQISLKANKYETQEVEAMLILSLLAAILLFRPGTLRVLEYIVI